jgi:A/G-specific adenine glycosylase
MTAAADLVPRLRTDLLGWYDAEQRDLPWRRPGTSPWAVLVSEVMLQQTPVRRVLPAWTAWLERWPTPADLAREPSGAAVRAWDRLGYPRRALRLHAAATAITQLHGGRVPETLAELLALPGIGAYTARALLAFAFRQRVPVVDVNVRRVVARAVEGRALGPVAVSAGDLRTVEALLPAEPEEAAAVSVALMELGALVCTATRPRCPACPLLDACAWVAAGRPPHDGPPRVAQRYAGTDRQVRGRLLAVLRGADAPVAAEVLAAVWDDAVQRDRALAGLLADGLAERTPAGYRLPA